jgi:hypothetical protein
LLAHFLSSEKAVEYVFDPTKASTEVSMLVAVFKWPTCVSYPALGARTTRDLAVAFVFPSVTL